MEHGVCSDQFYIFVYIIRLFIGGGIGKHINHLLKFSLIDRQTDSFRSATGRETLDFIKLYQ